jgi:hypothetical protein
MRLNAAVRLTSMLLPMAGALAQTSDSHKVPVPSVTAARRTAAIVLDARLDEEAWKAAAPITEFRQVDPDEGKPATQRTEVRFLYDDDALYVGARMHDTEGAKGVTTRLVRRDGNFDSDFFEIVIDGYHDHLSRAFFDVNPSGSKGDYIGIGTSCCDASWDPVWEVSTQIDAGGWTAEIRIPYSQLRFSRDSVQTWGLQVRRFIKRTNEQDDWSWWGKTESGGPQRFGHLEGLRIPHAPAGLELLPYVVSKSTSVARKPGDPFDTRGVPTFRAGLDLKSRLTSNLTLDASFNPDFGQVEVDPAVVNLSAFETFFPEKRPFFIEGSQVFNFGGFSCNFCSNVEDMSAFYSRRVGRSPTGASLAVNANPYADVPDATTILAAAKITGRTATGWTVGLLNAVTGNATARVQTTAGDRATQKVEPLADYFIGRLKRDYRRGNLVVGGVVSGVTRKLDDAFTPRLAQRAGMYGNDVFLTWKERMYAFQASAAVTSVDGDPRAILIRQQSSARYFQRPDRGAGSGGFLSNRLDSTATSMRGVGAYARLSKNTGDWFGELQMNTRTPGYETNDYAFQRSADYIWGGGNIGRIWTKPTTWYRQIITLAGFQTQNNYEGDLTQRQLHAFWTTTTPQFWNATILYINRPSVMDDRALRGGPVIQTVAGQFVAANASTDSRKRVVGEWGADVYWDAKKASSLSYFANATYRPVSNLSVSFGPSFSTGRSYAQYVDVVSDTTSNAFYDKRYVMASLDQRTLGLDTRVNWTFSPTMTLELYMQPFLSSGNFFDFKEYTAPRTTETAVFGRDRGTISELRDTADKVVAYSVDPDGTGAAQAFTVGNPDFTQQSLRGNAVFRWEYRPGSVFYVAWTQSRFMQRAHGDLDFSRDREALFATRPDNIFLVKASLWIPR